MGDLVRAGISFFSVSCDIMKTNWIQGGYMTKADTIFKENIRKIMEEGVWSEQARPKYKDGRTANSKYITGAFMVFDLAKGEFPLPPFVPSRLNQPSKRCSGSTKISRIAWTF